MIECKFEKGNLASPGLRHVTTGTIVLRDGKLMLCRRAEGLIEAGKWGFPGGFLDRDETIAEGARREVLEETGWEVGELTLFRINDNPDRPMEDRQNVDFIFVAEARQRVAEPDAETAAVKWFELDDLPETAFDHRDSVELYREHLHKRFTLPLLYNR